MALSSFSAGAARADIPVADEPMDYVAGLNLNGQDGGTGWSGPWFASGFNAQLHDNYLTAAGSLARPAMLPAGGRVASVSMPQIAGLGRNLAVPVLATDTVTVYWSLLVRPEGTLGDGIFNGFFGLYLDGTASAGDADLFVGKPGSSAQANYVLEARGGAGQVPSGVPAAIGQPALLVVRADFTPGLDRFTLYVNPDPCGAEPATGTVKADLDLGDVGAVVIYSSGAFSLDEVHVGSTFLGVLGATGLDCESPPVVDEPFAYGPGGNLDGKNGGTGFAGPWSPSGFNASIFDNNTAAAGSLSVAGLSPSGNRVAGLATQAIAGLGRNLESPIHAGNSLTVYWSFLLRPEGVLGGGDSNGFFGLYLDGTAEGGNADLFVGKPGSSAQANYVLEARGGAGQVPSGVPATIGQPALLVVRADFTPGLDRFTLHVNPDPCEAEPAGGTVKGDLDLGDVTAIVVYSTGAFSLDEIHLGPTYSSVLQATGLDCTPAALQLPGDCNQDGTLDLSDAVCTLGFLFLGTPDRLPCADGRVNHPANITLLDSNGDRGIDLSDAVGILSYLFSGGPPPVAGTECIPIEGCPAQARCR